MGEPSLTKLTFTQACNLHKFVYKNVIWGIPIDNRFNHPLQIIFAGSGCYNDLKKRSNYWTYTYYIETGYLTKLHQILI